MKLTATLVVIALSLGSLARAQTPCYAANDGPSFNDGALMGGPWIAIRFTAPMSIVAQRLEVFTGEAIGLNTLALRTHDAALNQPGTQLASSVWNDTSLNNDWKGGTLSSQVALSAGVTYWFVWVPVVDAQASIDSTPPGLGQLYRASFDNGLSWAGPFQDSFNHWKLRIFGQCTVPPVVYCTAGTTANGCSASIYASDNPDVAHSNTCQIAVANVEGLKVGIVFYGLAAFVQPWCQLTPGSSFLCVKSPTVRTGVQSSGGTFGSCNGSLALDWNAFHSANPGALGAPWSAGERAYLQAWFRDPASCKTTSLSNAVELTYQP